MPSTPTSTACSTADRAWAWAVTGRPASCASCTINRQNRRFRFAGRTGPLPVTAFQDAEAPIAEIADRGHTCGELKPQALRDDRIELVIGEPGDPIQGADAAVRDEMHMGVDQPRQGCRVGMVDYLPLLADFGKTLLNAHDPVPVAQHRGAAGAEPFTVEHLCGPNRKHLM